MKILLRGKESVYEQIVNEYKKYITLNIYKYDDKLPSCRALATELGINPNTVQRAYNVLEEEGYIRTIPKKGVYVSYCDTSNNTLSNEIADYLRKLKTLNVSYESIIKILDSIYGGENND